MSEDSNSRLGFSLSFYFLIAFCSQYYLRQPQMYNDTVRKSRTLQSGPRWATFSHCTREQTQHGLKSSTGDSKPYNSQKNM